MEVILVDIQLWFWDFLPKAVWAIGIFVLGWYFSGVLARMLRKVMEQHNVDPGVTNLAHDVVRWGLLIYSGIMALQQFTDVTAFLAGLGILGFTVGFALQETMKNFAAGVLLLVQKPFRIGDSISVQGFDGTVTAINLRSTELVDINGRVVILPNAEVLGHAIINFTRSVRRRLQVMVGVAYGSDLNKVSQVALDAVRGIPGVLEDPAPQAMLSVFGAASVDVTLYIWVDTTRVGLLAVQDQAIKNLHQAFEANGIEIPYPTQTLLMKRES